MEITIRPARAEDAARCGPICFQAFKRINEQHGFPCDFPAEEIATGLLTMMLTHPGFYGVVAEADGRVIGSNVLDERNPIAGVGPITVDPSVQNAAVGRRLMEAVLERARARKFPGVRLVQAAFHNRSLSLYTKLGFDVRESLACMQGKPPGVTIAGRAVRRATEADRPACATLCRQVHGHDRDGELADGIKQGLATVVEHDGRITGYASGLAFFAHAVGETNDDVKALISAAKEFVGPGFLLPTRNAELFRWCLAQGLRVVEPLTLMSMGLYNEPSGAFLPSITY